VPLQPQSLHRPAPDDVGLENLVHVLDLDPAVPDPVGVDDHRHPEGAGVHAQRLVGPDLSLEAELRHLLLEAGVYRLAALLTARPFGIAVRAPVDAGEDVESIGRHAPML